jgi:hypothetical protein
VQHADQFSDRLARGIGPQERPHSKVPRRNLLLQNGLESAFCDAMLAFSDMSTYELCTPDTKTNERAISWHRGLNDPYSEPQFFESIVFELNGAVKC